MTKITHAYRDQTKALHDYFKLLDYVEHTRADIILFNADTFDADILKTKRMQLALIKTLEHPILGMRTNKTIAEALLKRLRVKCYFWDKSGKSVIWARDAAATFIRHMRRSGIEIKRTRREANTEYVFLFDEFTERLIIWKSREEVSPC